jgi:hypothetical protein
MLQRPAMHFEQVSLRSISRIVEEEMRRKKVAEKSRETDSGREAASSDSKKERP